MSLTIDTAAIALNARTVRTRCDVFGIAPVAVVKSAYALPEIVRAVAEGGIDEFVASSPDAARLVRTTTGRACGMIGPASLEALLAAEPQIPSGLVTRSDEAVRALSSGSGFVWLSVMTSDGRDGLGLEALLDFVAVAGRIAGAWDRCGFSLTWGCLGGAPGREELERQAGALAAVFSAAGRGLPVSVGGSALLPLLEDLRLPGVRELRVGEALLTGSIPDADGSALGLRAPVRLSASVIEVQERGGNLRVVVDRGWTSIHVRDVRLTGLPSRPVAASSDVSLFELLPESARPSPGESVELVLGYRSAVRALLNRTIVARVT